MDNLIADLKQRFEGKIDFAGQAKANQVSTYMLYATGVLSFLLGFIAQDLRVTLGVFGFGVLLTLLLLAPPWPFLRQHPVTWLEPREDKKQQ